VSGVVLDTSVLSFAFKNDSRFDLYLDDIDGQERFVSFQTVAEMRLGGLASRWGLARRQRLEGFLATLEVVVYTDELAWRWSQVMYAARQSGRRLEAGDGWIAATAMLLGVPLVTHDRDFADLSIPGNRTICHA
jgi:predicted nucleic acid-binding protein